MNIQHLLKQAQQMQNQIGKVEKEIEATEYTATAGGDAVKVTPLWMAVTISSSFPP